MKLKERIARAEGALAEEMRKGGFESIRATTFFIEPSAEISADILEKSGKVVRDLREGKLRLGLPRPAEIRPEFLEELFGSLRRLNNGELEEIKEDL